MTAGPNNTQISDVPSGQGDEKDATTGINFPLPLTKISAKMSPDRESRLTSNPSRNTTPVSGLLFPA
jgi:hypothetical protein